MTTIKAFATAILLAAVSIQPVFAQTSATSTMPQPVTECIALTTNHRYGNSDSSSRTDIAALQQFLSQKGFFDASNLGTGHFGHLTLNAVTKFQASVNLPATGFVGPLTRREIKTETCGTPTPTAFAPVLYSLSPLAAPVGATTSVTGFGFTATNTILMDGLVAARNVPIASSIAVSCTTDPSCHGGIRQTLQFAVPKSLSPNCAPGMMCMMLVRLTTPGTYSLTVLNSNGTSAALPLVVSTSTDGTSQIL